MLKYLAILVCMNGHTLAMACTDLDGEYRCIKHDEARKIRFQTVEKEPLVIKINEEVLSEADGWVEYKDEGTIGLQKLFCDRDSEKLGLHLKGDFYNSKDEKFGTFDVVNSFYLSDTTTLTWLQTGEYIFDFDDEPWPISEITNCTKL